jgi:large subunit ribosomal protein L10
MLKQEKERIVAELAERLKSTQTLFVADYRGLSVTEIDDLRTKRIEHGARFTVVKNTLTRRAAEVAGTDALLALLDGPTAIAFIEADGDLVAVAKALADSARTTKVLAIRGGILEGAPIGEDDVKNLATLPPVDQLRGQVLGAITSPLTTIVGLISAPVQNLIGLIDARIEQLKGQGESENDSAASAAEAEADDADKADAVGVAPTEEPAAEESTAEEPIAEAAATEEPVAAEPEDEAPETDETSKTKPATDEAATEQPSEEE